MGADRGVLVETNAELQPRAVAKLLKAVIPQENPEIVIVGQQAIDDDCNQTGQTLSALLGWPQQGAIMSKWVTGIARVCGQQCPPRGEQDDLRD